MTMWIVSFHLYPHDYLARGRTKSEARIAAADFIVQWVDEELVSGNLPHFYDPKAPEVDPLEGVYDEEIIEIVSPRARYTEIKDQALAAFLETVIPVQGAEKA